MGKVGIAGDTIRERADKPQAVPVVQAFVAGVWPKLDGKKARDQTGERDKTLVKEIDRGGIEIRHRPQQDDVADHAFFAGRRLLTVAEGALDIPMRFALGVGVPLVVELLAADHPDVEFGATAAEAEAEGNQGHPLLLDLGAEVNELPLVDEELPRPVRVVVAVAAVAIRGDVGANQPQLAVVDSGVSFGDRGFAFADRFDLGPGQGNACLDRLDHEIVVKGAPIRRDDAVVPTVGRVAPADGRFCRHSTDYRAAECRRQTSPCLPGDWGSRIENRPKRHLKRWAVSRRSHEWKARSGIVSGSAGMGEGTSMDGRRFDEMARVLATTAPGSRRRLLRRLLGGGVAAAALGRTGPAKGQEAMVAPGDACTSTDECAQSVGELTVVCDSNGIEADGALNCCRNFGGFCLDGTGCCGVLECVGGICGGGTTVESIPGNPTSGVPVGSPCTTTTQCLSSISGDVICASNNIAADGELNCCLQTGGQCGGQDELCCGDLLCVDGSCSATDVVYGAIEPGGNCDSHLDCGQDGGPSICSPSSGGSATCCRLEVSSCASDAECCADLICGDNMIAEDGELTCCSVEGGLCESDAACCGNNYCVDGACQALS